MKRHTILKTISSAFAAILLITSPARAQFAGNMGQSEPFSSEDVSDMGEFLSMSDDQIATARDMHQGYFTTFQEDRQTLTEAIQAAVQEAQRTNDMSIYSEIGEMAWEFDKSSRKNLDRLFEDIKLILDEDQLERWSRYEIRAFRRQTFPTISGQGVSISGASTDLIDIYEHNIADRLDDDPDAKQTVESILDRYAREMHAALKSFAEVRRDTTERSLEIGMNWMQNMGVLEEIVGDFIDAAIAVRDVNDRYVDRIAAALQLDARDEWQTRYNRAASPTIYTPNYVNESFDTALELTDLTDEQRTRLDDLRDRYESDAETINAKWDDALRESQESFSLTAMMQGQTSSPEATKLGNERAELDASTYESLASILTDEQSENLPAKPSSNWRDRFQFSNGQ